MAEQGTFFRRLGKWFRGGETPEGELPLIQQDNTQAAIEPVQAARSTFLRPWAKRDETLAKVNDAFQSLTGLMGTIRDHLEKQSQRQEELLGYLSHLPEVMRQIPEANRAQAEALRAIHQQITRQSDQQQQLGAILDRICQASANHQSVLEALNQNVDHLNHHDEAITNNLQSVGSAMESVSRHSQASTEVLENLRDNLSSRDGQLERILVRQNTRFTTMLAVAILLSVAALVAVSILGYLLLNRP